MASNFLISENGENILISFDDILYLKTTKKDHHIEVITRKKIFLVKTSLKYLEAKYVLLVRCHRQFLVNVHTIQGIDKKKGIISFFEEERTCPISRRCYKKIVKLWINYVDKYVSSIGS